jgi:hypothetical protein
MEKSSISPRGLYCTTLESYKPDRVYSVKKFNLVEVGTASTSSALHSHFVVMLEWLKYYHVAWL